jgi:hypothetical protein
MSEPPTTCHHGQPTPELVVEAGVADEVQGQRREWRRLASFRSPLRTAVWNFVRPMLSPRLAELHRDAFVSDDGPGSSVDLAAHRGESRLEDLDIGEPNADAA